MSTDKPVGATLITKYEAQQIGRANASGRTPVSRLLFGEGEGEGEGDHTVPCAVTNAAFKRRQRNKGLTEIVEVPGAGTRSPSTAGATSPAQRWCSCRASPVAMTHRPWVAK